MDKQQIALDPVAAHLNRKAQFFENEALILAGQVRDLLGLIPDDPEPVVVTVDEQDDPLDGGSGTDTVINRTGPGPGVPL